LKGGRGGKRRMVLGEKKKERGKVKKKSVFISVWPKRGRRGKGCRPWAGRKNRKKRKSALGLFEEEAVEAVVVDKGKREEKING